MRSRFGFVGSLAIALAIAFPAKSAGQYMDAWKFPPELRFSLNDRVLAFTQAQADSRWEDVSELLGSYRRGYGYMPFTGEHKACLISQMQRSPMVSFTFEIQESPFSSEILRTPPGKRWWTLTGEAVFLENGRESRKRYWLTAYQDRGDWYFTPAPFDDNAWAREHLTDDQLRADHKDKVELLVPPDSPIEIIELHVFINPKRLSSRQIEFRLRNKTSKRIEGYGFEIGDDGGSISVGTGSPGDQIDPYGVSRKWEQDFAAYTYWCEGERKIRFRIQSARFDDGSEWNAPDLNEPTDTTAGDVSIPRN